MSNLSKDQMTAHAGDEYVAELMEILTDGWRGTTETLLDKPDTVLRRTVIDECIAALGSYPAAQKKLIRTYFPERIPKIDGRKKTHCIRGHERIQANIRRKNECRICHNQKCYERRRRQRLAGRAKKTEASS